MTFFTGRGRARRADVQGQLLAAEEINAAGGLLGKRKIEILRPTRTPGLTRTSRSSGA